MMMLNLGIGFLEAILCISGARPVQLLPIVLSPDSDEDSSPACSVFGSAVFDVSWGRCASQKNEAGCDCACDLGSRDHYKTDAAGR